MFHRLIVSIFLIGILLIIVGFVQENTYHHTIATTESDDDIVKPDYIYDELNDLSNNDIYFDNENETDTIDDEDIHLDS